MQPSGTDGVGAIKTLNDDFRFSTGGDIESINY